MYKSKSETTFNLRLSNHRKDVNKQKPLQADQQIRLPRHSLKLVSAIFYQIFISHQMIALSSKKLFSFSRYSSFCISIFSSFSTCQPLL